MLLRWQWPDGGWNCDRNPAARMSSLMETTLPMVALHECGVRAPARRAAEVLLERRVVFHRGSDQLLRADFAALHHPLYWHYDLLGGLKALARLDLLAEPRCVPALDLLESLQVTDGWPAHRRHYRRVSTDVALHNDSVDWGPTSVVRANPWVTVDALSVLRRAGRS